MLIEKDVEENFTSEELRKAQLSRCEKIFNDEGLARLWMSKILVFGVGGVGGTCVEALIRGGIGSITLVDGDSVDISNLNRQIITKRDNIGMTKVEVMKERIKSINPDIEVKTYCTFYLPNMEVLWNYEDYDYVVDAIDTVAAKLEIARKCNYYNIPLISSMGTGNKIDPTLFKVSTIEKTRVCPLAKALRKKVKEEGIGGYKVVYSEEEVVTRHRPPGSTSFVPGTCGLIMAGEVIKDITGIRNKI